MPVIHWLSYQCVRRVFCALPATTASNSIAGGLFKSLISFGVRLSPRKMAGEARSHWYCLSSFFEYLEGLDQSQRPQVSDFEAEPNLPQPIAIWCFYEFEMH